MSKCHHEASDITYSMSDKGYKLKCWTRWDFDLMMALDEMSNDHQSYYSPS